MPDIRDGLEYIAIYYVDINAHSVIQLFIAVSLESLLERDISPNKSTQHINIMEKFSS